MPSCFCRLYPTLLFAPVGPTLHAEKLPSQPASLAGFNNVEWICILPSAARCLIVAVCSVLPCPVPRLDPAPTCLGPSCRDLSRHRLALAHHHHPHRRLGLAAKHLAAALLCCCRLPLPGRAPLFPPHAATAGESVARLATRAPAACDARRPLSNKYKCISVLRSRGVQLLLQDERAGGPQAPCWTI